MALITPEELADELHIDQTEEEIKSLTNAINDASSLVLSSIANGLTAEAVLKVAPQFNRLVASVAQNMYYDPAMSDGLSHGQMILLQQITGIVDWNAEVSNGNI